MRQPDGRPPRTLFSHPVRQVDLEAPRHRPGTGWTGETIQPSRWPQSGTVAAAPDRSAFS